MRTTEERRWHYRVEYPERATPVFDFHLGSAPVLDLSELGLRFDVPAGASVPHMDTEIEGVLRLHEARKVTVKVIVARTCGRQVSCRVVPAGIPLTVIFAEQRWLRSRYPLRFRATS